MITIVIGQAGSGKTTFVKNKFITPDCNYHLFDIPIKYTSCKDILLLGDYVSNKRCLGTDTLAYNALPKIIEFIKENKEHHIIAEGDRINNKRFFEEISKLKIPVEVYVLSCSLEESIKRLRKEGSKIKESYVKRTMTKTKNNKELCKKLNFKVIEIKMTDAGRIAIL